MTTDTRYEPYFTAMKYRSKIRSMIYCANGIEQLKRDCKCVWRMCGALADEKDDSGIDGLSGHDQDGTPHKIALLDKEEGWLK